jgi:hypothetical protein
MLDGSGHSLVSGIMSDSARSWFFDVILWSRREAFSSTISFHSLTFSLLEIDVSRDHCQLRFFPLHKSTPLGLLFKWVAEITALGIFPQTYGIIPCNNLICNRP